MYKKKKKLYKAPIIYTFPQLILSGVFAIKNQRWHCFE